MTRAHAEADAGDRAIGFWLTLTSGEATPADHAACNAWRAADPAHERAWGRLQQGLTQSVGRLEPAMKHDRDDLRRTLERPGRRRVLLGVAGLAGAASTAAWTVNRVMPLGNLMADLGTATGERRQYTLPDGSLLTLDARSRVDLDFTGGARNVRLLEGALVIQPRESTRSRLAVHTPHGQVQSGGASCMVRLEPQSSLAVALQDGVDIVTRQAKRLTLLAGAGAHFGEDWIDAPSPDLQDAAAWRDGWFKARDQPLGELIAALARYRSGVLRVSPQAARVEVSGFYPLDDTDRALSALEHTLPLSITRYTRWLTVIDLRAA